MFLVDFIPIRYIIIIVKGREITNMERKVINAMEAERQSRQFRNEENARFADMEARGNAKVAGMTEITEEEAKKEILDGNTVTLKQGSRVVKASKNGNWVLFIDEEDDEIGKELIHKDGRFCISYLGKCDPTFWIEK